MDERTRVRFWDKVDVAADDECWQWTASKKDTGYGQFNDHGRIRLAHHIAYELCIGPRPPRLKIDHACRNRACVNPNHLRMVTNSQNVSGASTSASQILGVSTASSGMFRAHVTVNGKYIHLGHYATKQEAAAAARGARLAIFTHNEHDKESA